MKQLIAAALIGVSLLVTAGCGNSHKPGVETAVTAQANTPASTIQKSIATTIDKSKYSNDLIILNKIEVNEIDGGYNVNIWGLMNDKEKWDESLAIDTIKLYAIPAYAGAFNSGENVVRVSFLVQAHAKAGDANSPMIKVYQSELRAEDAKQFDWKNEGAIDAKKLSANAFVHKAFK